MNGCEDSGRGCDTWAFPRSPWGLLCCSVSLQELLHYHSGKWKNALSQRGRRECGLRKLFSSRPKTKCVRCDDAAAASGARRVLVRCGSVVFFWFVCSPFIIVHVFPAGPWRFSFHGFLLRCPDFRAGGLWDRGCRSKKKSIALRATTFRRRRVHSSSKKQFYSASESPCVLLFKAANAWCYKCGRERRTLPFVLSLLLTLWSPQESHLPFSGHGCAGNCCRMCPSFARMGFNEYCMLSGDASCECKSSRQVQSAIQTVYISVMLVMELVC